MKHILSLAVMLAAAPAAPADGVEILNVVAHRYGANYNFNYDMYMRNGWSVTDAGVTDSVLPCHGSLPVLEMDTLLQDVGAAGDFDAVCLMPATWRYQPDPYRDIMDDAAAMGIIEEAAALGVPLWLTCVGPRVLAYADLLEGVEIQGEPGDQNEFLEEYVAAGAVYLGTGLPPVTDQAVITTTRGQYYQAENCAAILSALAAAAGTGPTQSCTATTEVSPAPASGNALWAMTYGGPEADGARDACLGPQGNVAIAGYTYSFGEGLSDAYVVCCDSTGAERWSLAWGGPGFEYAEAIVPCSDGYAVTGCTTSEGAGAEDAFLLRISGDGQLLWTATYGGAERDIAHCLASATGGGFLVGGQTWSTGAGESDGWLVRTDFEGDTVWTRTYGGSGPDGFEALAVLPDGEVALTGFTGSFTSNMDAYLVLADSSGSPNETHFYGGSGGEGGYDRASAITILDEGGFLLTGDTNSDDKCGVFAVRVEDDGTEVFQDCYGGSFYDFGRSATILSDGSWLLCGATKSRPSCDDNAWLTKLTPDGETVWTETHGTPGTWDWGETVLALPRGGAVMAGQTASWGAGAHDVWLVRLADPATGLEPQRSAGELRLSPNPTSGSVSIASGIAGNGVVSVFGLDGRLVMETGLEEGTAQLDTRLLPAGVYAVQARSGADMLSALISVI